MKNFYPVYSRYTFLELYPITPRPTRAATARRQSRVPSWSRLGQPTRGRPNAAVPFFSTNQPSRAPATTPRQLSRVTQMRAPPCSTSQSGCASVQQRSGRPAHRPAQQPRLFRAQRWNTERPPSSLRHRQHSEWPWCLDGRRLWIKAGRRLTADGPSFGPVCGRLTTVRRRGAKVRTHPRTACAALAASAVCTY